MRYVYSLGCNVDADVVDELLKILVLSTRYLVIS